MFSRQQSIDGGKAIDVLDPVLNHDELEAVIVAAQPSLAGLALLPSRENVQHAGPSVGPLSPLRGLRRVRFRGVDG